jgi:hypothetical protein
VVALNESTRAEPVGDLIDQVMEFAVADLVTEGIDDGQSLSILLCDSPESNDGFSRLLCHVSSHSSSFDAA